MTPAQMLPHLQRWAAVQAACEDAFGKLEELTALDSESPLGRAIWDTFEAYTRTLGQLVGDHHEWLHWYHYENDMGRRQHEAGYRGDLRPVSSLEDLADLIHAGTAPSDPEAPLGADPSAYWRAGLRDLLSASLLHALHRAGNAGLTVELALGAIRADHAAALAAFHRLVRAGLAVRPRRQTGRGRPYCWTITPAGSAVVTAPPLLVSHLQPLLEIP